MYTRLLKALSSTAFNISRDEASTADGPEQHFPLSHPLTVKDLFLTSHLNLLPFTLKPFPLLLSLHGPCNKSLSSSFAVPFRYRKVFLSSLQSLMFSKLNNPNSLSLPSQERHFRPLTNFHNPSLELLPHPHPSYAGDLRTGCSLPGGMS